MMMISRRHRPDGRPPPPGAHAGLHLTRMILSVTVTITVTVTVTSTATATVTATATATILHDTILIVIYCSILFYDMLSHNVSQYN